MHHVRTISQQRPAEAQFESILQLITMVNSIFGTMSQFLAILNTVFQFAFGINLYQK